LTERGNGVKAGNDRLKTIPRERKNKFEELNEDFEVGKENSQLGMLPIFFA
jgi:hypothetical protein